MRATVVASSRAKAYALAFGLGVAIALLGASLAHAEAVQPASGAQIAEGLLPPLPNDSFICYAQPGRWCDLRDWRGFAARPAPRAPAILY